MRKELALHLGFNTFKIIVNISNLILYPIILLTVLCLGSNPVILVNNEDDGTYHASPYLINEEGRPYKDDSKLSENINLSQKEEFQKNCMPLRSLKPEYNKDIPRKADDSSRRHYVNQSELTSKVTQLPISAGLPAAVNHEVDVVVAIDLGTTYSGYAYCFTNHHFDKEVHMMKKWEGRFQVFKNLLVFVYIFKYAIY